MANTELARRRAYPFIEPADKSEAPDAARYRLLAATRFPLNAQPKAQFSAALSSLTSSVMPL